MSLRACIMERETVGIENRPKSPQSTRKLHRAQRNSYWSRVGHLFLTSLPYFSVLHCRILARVAYIADRLLVLPVMSWGFCGFFSLTGVVKAMCHLMSNDRSNGPIAQRSTMPSKGDNGSNVSLSLTDGQSSVNQWNCIHQSHDQSKWFELNSPWDLASVEEWRLENSSRNDLNKEKHTPRHASLSLLLWLFFNHHREIVKL